MISGHRAFQVLLKPSETPTNHVAQALHKVEVPGLFLFSLSRLDGEAYFIAFNFDFNVLLTTSEFACILFNSK